MRDASLQTSSSALAHGGYSNRGADYAPVLDPSNVVTLDQRGRRCLR